MTDRPILFSGAMVQAILAGRKTQTRRVMKQQPIEVGQHWEYRTPEMSYYMPRGGECDDLLGIWDACPYGRRGDRLWVRENWKLVGWQWEDAEQKIMYCDGSRWVFPTLDIDWEMKFEDWLMREYERVVAHPSTKEVPDSESEFGPTWKVDESALPWRPSMFMPRWASRINLEITGIRVERVQEITDADVCAEGVPDFQSSPELSRFMAMGAKAWYSQLWDKINAKRGYGWALDPWVWVVEFRRCV